MTDTITRSVLRPWFLIGILLLTYCYLGNFFVLPSYLRFLEHGSTGNNGTGPDYALIWGAAKTILWMLSFHLGAACLTFGALSGQGASRRFRVGLGIGTVVWLGLWCIPALPGPYTAYFAGMGLIILLVIVALFLTTGGGRADDSSARNWRVASYMFFAFATWDICGLGSVGGILDPEGAARSASQSLVVTQTTKLIAELLIGWALALTAAVSARRPQST
ncbi:hypothetical protein [Maritimibacter sp. UBA3975]|uniref:hypothetical protein n=1 Tax=Maritimibacter sp. UBA3975 TaxID=1946833 RepID=UPI000C09D92E|nr:hypothetical protein [Maritimibacter sp. UBA3975]MAM62583.1 hypothetical protein [Maritimibacter sp.]|tara:strand:- start:4678 stop:5337 length:660 start_codon:yes stop_codon:yes gene_type:complete